MPAHGQIYRGSDFVLLRYVGAEERCRRKVGGELFSAFNLNIGKYKLRTFRREEPRRRFPDSASRARDDGDFSSQTINQTVPLSTRAPFTGLFEVRVSVHGYVSVRVQDAVDTTVGIITLPE